MAIRRVTRYPVGMIPSGVKIFLTSQPVDFRKGPDWLVGPVRDAGAPARPDPSRGQDRRHPIEQQAPDQNFTLRFALKDCSAKPEPNCPP